MLKKILIVFVLCFFSFLVQTNAIAPICIYENTDVNEGTNMIFYDGSSLKLQLHDLDRDNYTFTLTGFPISTATKTDESDEEAGPADGVEDVLEVLYNDDDISSDFNNRKVCPEYIYAKTNIDYMDYAENYWHLTIYGVIADVISDGTLDMRFQGHEIMFSDKREMPDGYNYAFTLKSGLVNDSLSSGDLEFLLTDDVDQAEDLLKYYYHNFGINIDSDGLRTSLISSFDNYKDYIDSDMEPVDVAMILKIIGVYNDYYEMSNRIVNTIDPSNGTCALLSEQQCQDLYDAASEFLEEYNANGLNGITQDVNSCEDIIGDPNVKGSFAYYLVEILDFIKFLAPVLVIVLTISDYVKAICASDNDVMKKNNKRLIKRLIYMVVLFIIPIVIKFVLDKIIFEAHGCGIL